MADTLKRMYFGQPSTSSATLYTAPGSGGTTPTAIMRTIHVTNTSSSAATISFALNDAAATAANQIISSFAVPGNGIFVESLNIVLNGGDYITGLQGTSGALTAIISGIEL